MTAVEIASRVQDSHIELTLSKNEIIAYHSKAIGLCVATLKNKERPISTVELLWFGAAGETFPFVIDPELKMNNRMPFSKIKERFPNQLFSKMPCLGKDGVSRGDYRVGYCEIRGYNDTSNNILKTAEYLSINKWVGIINTSEGGKLYLLPTCSVSHELGITQANHPQMLHGVFVKKNPRESRSHAHRTQLASSSEKVLKESTLGNSSKQWQEEATGSVPVGVTPRRRVSFAPILTTPSMSPDSVITKVGVPSSSQKEGELVYQEEQESSDEMDGREEIAAESVEEKMPKQDNPSSTISVEVGSSSQTQHPVLETILQTDLSKYLVLDTPSQTFGEAKDCDTRFSPASEMSEDGSIASSLSSSASVYESPQTAKRGRGKRGQRGGRTRGRGKRVGVGRGGVMVENSGEANEEVNGLGRGGRGKKKRGRGTRGVRGKGRGRGGGSPDSILGELEDFSLQPDAKRTKLDLVAEKEKSARDNNTVLYEMLDGQAIAITSIQQSTSVPMVSLQYNVPKQLHIQVNPNAQVQLQVLHQAPLVSKQETTTSQMSPIEQELPKNRLSQVKTDDHKDEKSEEEEKQKPDATQSFDTPLPMSIIAAEGMVVAETDVEDDKDDGENENIPDEVVEEEVRDSDLQVHEEVVLAVHSDHEMSDQMEIDSGPYFHPPRPPRRVSLLEYKERMKGKKKYPSDEPQQGDSEKPSEKESCVMSPLNEGVKDNIASQPSKLHDIQQAIMAVKKSPAIKDASGHVAVAVASHFLRSVIDTKMADNNFKDSLKQSSEQQITKKATDTPNNPVIQQGHEPSSIKWPTIDSDESREENQESSRVISSEVSVEIESENTKEKIDVKKTVNNEPMEVVEKELQVKNSTSVCEQKDEEEDKKLQENKESKQKEEMEKKREQEKEREWAKRLEELEREWKKKKERERIKEEKEKQRIKEERERERIREGREKERLKEEKEKNRMKEVRERKMARKAAKPVESWKPSNFPSNQKRFNIPIRHGPTFHPRPRPIPIPAPVIPPPQPPPPQPFIGFPHTPFHQPPPAPFVPPHPRPPPLPQPDVWSMFGNLFVQHNLFPAEEPPPPPPRSPSPPLPSNRFSPPRRKSPRRSPPLHRSSPPPHIDPPRPRSTSPTVSPHHRISPEPASFPIRRKSGSPSPVSKPWPLEPKPRQLDAKQFRVISELVKRTTVKKCDVSVQAVPPRMVSEGTQDGTGFRLCSTAVQVKARTYSVATLTDCKPEIQDRYVQTSAVPTRNTCTQTQPRSRNVAIQTTRAFNNPLVASLDDFDSLLDAVGCTYPAIDAIVSRVEDWLSRQASLSTDTGSTSDYEPEDMCCDEDDQEREGEHRDGVFVSPEGDTILSPVVSGASNISDGDLSDIVSPSIDGKTTEIPNDKIVSQPLASSNECVPSPPPPPPINSLVAADSISIPPPPLIVSSNRIGSLPPWARRVTNNLSTNTSLVAEDESNSKIDIGEAFADQMLEEQLSKSTNASKTSSSKSPLNSVKVGVENTKSSIDNKQENDSVTEQSSGVTAAQGDHHSSAAITTEVDVKPGHKSTIQKKLAALTQQGCSVSDKSTSLSVRISPLSIKGMEVISKSEKTAKDASDKMSHSSGESTGDLQLGSHTTHSVVKEMNKSDEQEEQLPSLAELKGSTTKHSSAGSNDDSDQTDHSTEVTTGSKSHSASPRRSMRHRQQATKVQTTSNLSTSESCKSKMDSTESDEPQDSSSNKNVQPQHKYETRHRRRSEAEEDQHKEPSKREERRELRSRHKHHTEDSSFEKRERRDLRPRSKGGKEDNRSSKNESKRTKGKRVRDDDETEHRKIKHSREKSPPSTKTGRKIEEKPTMQVFEDECINYESGNTISSSPSPSPDEKSCMQQMTVAKTKSDATKNVTEKKRECEVDLSSENDQEGKYDECYLRSVSLPPFKVVKTSPTSSPTDKKSPSSNDSPILNPRSISYSPPSSAAPKKKPTLTKEELLAMVRAKKKSSLTSPQQLHQPEHTSQQCMDTISGSDRDTVRSQLNMGELMVNFHKHMRTVSARKVSDASWIHPWSPSSHNVVLPFPMYSLLNPPPPPPGPPPSSVMRVCKTPEKTAQTQTREQGDLSSDIKESDQKRSSDDTAEVKESEEDLAKNAAEILLAEERLRESMMESVEMRNTEDTVSSLIQESIDENVTERVDKEESFEAVFMEKMENMIVQENVVDTVAISIAEKVTKLVQTEDAIQEQTVQNVGMIISSELIDCVVDEATSRKAVEVVKAEDILQEKAFEATEAKIVHETVTATVNEGVSMEARYTLRAEEILEEQTLETLEKSTVNKTVCDVIDVEIDRKITEEFLQEKAVATVSEKIMENVVENAIEKWMCDKVIEVLQSELINQVTNAMEEMILQECEAIIAESDTLEELVTEVVVLVEEDVTELYIRESEETAAIEAEFNEFELIAVTAEEVISEVEGELIQSLTDTTVCEALDKEDKIIFELEEIVADELQCEYLDEMKGEIVQTLVLEEEKKCSELIEGCLHFLEDILISDLVSEFVEQILNDALIELEERVIQKVEETCFEDIQQTLIDEIMTVNLEMSMAEKMYSVIIEEVVSAISEDTIVKEENTVAMIEERVSASTDKEILDGLENEIVTDLVDREESVSLAVEEQVAQICEGEILQLLPETIAAENVKEEIVEELGHKVCHTLEELCLDAVVNESASDRVTSQETTAAALEKKVSMELEEECVNEIENDVARELTVMEEVEEEILSEIVGQSAKEEVVVEQVTDVVLSEIESQFAREEVVEEQVRDIVFTEIEGQIAKEEAVEEQVREDLLKEIEGQVAREEMVEDQLNDLLLSEIVDDAAKEEEVEEQVADRLETAIMNHLEDDVAMLVADTEEKNRIAYEVMELFPDTVRCESNHSTHPHIHVMDRSPSGTDADQNNTVEYEITDLVPDSLAHKREPTHIHLLESETFLIEPELNNQDPIVRARAQSASTYVHFIEHSSSDVPLDSTTKTMSHSTATADPSTSKSKFKPPEMTEVVKSPTLKDILKLQETSEHVMQLPSRTQLPPVVFRPTLPKYISQNLRPRATKPIHLPSPPGGIEHPTPLSPTSSPHSVVGTPPGKKKRSVPPSTKRKGRKRSMPTSPTAFKRKNTGRVKESTSLSPSPTPTSTHQLRPRTRSQSSSCFSPNKKAAIPAVTSTPPVVSSPPPAPAASPLAAPSPSVLTHLALATVQVMEDSSIDLVGDSTSALKTYSPPLKTSTLKPVLPLENIVLTVSIPLAYLKDSHLEKESGSEYAVFSETMETTAVVAENREDDQSNDGSSTSTKERFTGSNEEDVEVSADAALGSGAIDLLMCPEEPTEALESVDLRTLTSASKCSNDPEPLTDFATETTSDFSSNDEGSDLLADLHSVLVEDLNPGHEFDLQATSCAIGEIEVKDSGAVDMGEIEEPLSKIQSSENNIHSDFQLSEDNTLLPDTLDLSSISLTALENVHSPVVSPVTGNSSSTTVSPRSFNEEMILRLEPSFSSAPETDSDQEWEQKPEQTTSSEINESVYIESSSLATQCMNESAIPEEVAETTTVSSEVSVNDGSTVETVDDRSTDIVVPNDGLATESLPMTLASPVTKDDDASKQVSLKGTNTVSTSDISESVEILSTTVHVDQPSSSPSDIEHLEKPYTPADNHSSLSLSNVEHTQSSSEKSSTLFPTDNHPPQSQSSVDPTLPLSPPQPSTSTDDRPAPSPPPPPPPMQKKLDLNNRCPPWATAVNDIDLTKQDESQIPEEEDIIDSSHKVTSKRDLSNTPFLMIVPTSSDSPTSPSCATVSSSNDAETTVSESDQTSSLQRKTLASLREGTGNLTSSKKQEVSSPNEGAVIPDTALLSNVTDEFISASIPSKSTPTPEEKTSLKDDDDDDLLLLLSSTNNEFMTAPIPERSRLSLLKTPSETAQVSRHESTTLLGPVTTLSFCEDVLPSTELSLPGTQQVSASTQESTEVTRKAPHSSFASFRTTTDRLWQSFADDIHPSLQSQSIPVRGSQRQRPPHHHHNIVGPSNYHHSRSHVMPGSLYTRNPEHIRPIYSNSPYLFPSPIPGPGPPSISPTSPLYPYPRAPYNQPLPYFQFPRAPVPMAGSAPPPRIPPPSGVPPPPRPHHRHFYGNPPPSRYGPYF